MKIFWPLERRYVSVEEQESSCRRCGKPAASEGGGFFLEGDHWREKREVLPRGVWGRGFFWRGFLGT